MSQDLEKLRGYYDESGFYPGGRGPRTYEEVISDFNLDGYRELFEIILDIFSREIIDFHCTGHCCHSLVPRLIIKAEEKGSMVNFNSYICRKWERFTRKEKENIVLNYKNFFRNQNEENNYHNRAERLEEMLKKTEKRIIENYNNLYYER